MPWHLIVNHISKIGVLKAIAERFISYPSGGNNGCKLNRSKTDKLFN